MSTSNKYSLDVWIGLAKVSSNNKKMFKNAHNAFVNVLGLANNKNDFRERVREELLHINLNLKRLEGVEIFNSRIKSFKVDKILYKLADELVKRGKGVKFSTFHTYE